MNWLAEPEPVRIVPARLRTLCCSAAAPKAFGAGGAEGVRTPDPHNAIVVLYQLSYDPIQSTCEHFKWLLQVVKRKHHPTVVKSDINEQWKIGL